MMSSYRNVTPLFLGWCDSVSGQSTIGPFTDAGLFAQGFSTNTILTEFADAALE
jgi:hypothetical protein